MWSFRRKKKQKARIANIFGEEDRVRRALAAGDFSPENVKFFRELAERRQKPADLVNLHRKIGQAELASLVHMPEFSHCSSRYNESRAIWAAKAGGPLRIAMFHVNQWHARLCEDVAELAGEELILRTDDEQELLSARPDAVISSYLPPDMVGRMRANLPETFWLYLRHGVANKRASFGIAGAFDAVCVSSQYIADFYCDTGFFPKEDIWITGYPPMDRLPEQRKFPSAGRRTVLYAPTFTPGLSSAASFRAELPAGILSVDSQLNMVVKLHPEMFNSDPATWEQYRQTCRKFGRAEFVEDREADLISLFGKTDILVSDFSSTAFLFLATGRPVVFLTPHGAEEGNEWLDPEGLEWKWRDMAEEVRDIPSLTAVLRKILDGQDDYAAIRKKYCKLLFDDTLDGQSAKRVMQRLGLAFGR